MERSASCRARSLSSLPSVKWAMPVASSRCVAAVHFEVATSSPRARLLYCWDSSRKSSIPMKRVSWHNPTMRGRASKGDVAQNALRVVEQAIGAPLKPERKIVQFPPHKKNPAAVALSKLGSRKGGIARANKLTPKERREIAQRAAKARWGKG